MKWIYKGPWVEMDLFTAAGLGDESLIKIFYEKKGNGTDSLNPEGWTELMEAVYRGRCGAARALVASGVDPGLGLPSPLMIAASSPDAQLLSLLYDKKFLEVKDWQGYTPLFYAVIYSQGKSAEFLLSKGSDPDVVANGNTPLTIACRNGHALLVYLLLKYGADATLSGKDGKPYEIATKYGHLEMAQLIQKACVSPNLKSILESTGLSQYWDIFQENGISLEKFLGMSEDDLKNIGVKFFGIRRKMAQIIAEMKRNQ